jgi:anaerobic selenocysteine-containing dehydrogenase
MMDVKGFDYSTTADVHAEIAGLVEGFGDFDNPERTAKPLTFEGKLTALETKKRAPSKGRKEYPFLLYTAVAEHVYRGVPLTAYVEGLKALFREDVIDLNPDDAAALDIADGDEIVLSASAFERTGRANIAPGQPRGTAQAAMNIEEFPGVNPHPVRIRKGHV